MRKIIQEFPTYVYYAVAVMSGCSSAGVAAAAAVVSSHATKWRDQEGSFSSPSQCTQLVCSPSLSRTYYSQTAQLSPLQHVQDQRASCQGGLLERVEYA